MYGLVNKALKSLIEEMAGEAMWINIMAKADMKDVEFMSNEVYNDIITYRLVEKSAEALNLKPEEFLYLFGRHWVLKTGMKYYGSLMQAGGRNFKEFLINLPNFHNRVMLYYPNITPPEFKVKESDANQIHLYYYSVRIGLTNFVHGLIVGIADMFNQTVEVKLVNSKNEQTDHDEFLITLV